MSLVELALKKMQEAAAKATPPPRPGRRPVTPAVPPAPVHETASLDDTARLKPVFPEGALESADGHAPESSADPGRQTVDPLGPGNTPAAFMETTRMESVVSASSVASPAPGIETALQAAPADSIFVTVTTAPADTAATIPVRGRMRSDRVVKIDRQSLRSQGLLPPEHQERALSDQYRQIKRPLIANAIGRGGAERLPRGQLIMVASAMPGEGKTFTSVNLALSLALEKDLSVLLIDADAPKPHLDRAFGVAGEPGLLDLLRDESLDPEALIIPTDVPTLAMLPIGNSSETTTELLASHRMEEIMRQLAGNDPMRIVIIDSPPLLLTSESRVLGEAAGQVVLVVRASHTSQQAVLDAISHLGEGKSIGLLLNQSTDVAPAGYYYGYGDSKT